MIGDSAPSSSRKSNALLPIAVGGLIAGALDLTQASILFGWRVPLTIAAGLLGRGAFHAGIATYFLGVLLHFFIAFSAAAVDQVMTLIVLPLSALHARGPYQLRDLIQGLLVHMVVVGLPISFSVRRFAK